MKLRKCNACESKLLKLANLAQRGSLLACPLCFPTQRIHGTRILNQAAPASNSPCVLSLGCRWLKRSINLRPLALPSLSPSDSLPLSVSVSIARVMIHVSLSLSLSLYKNTHIHSASVHIFTHTHTFIYVCVYTYIYIYICIQM